MKYAIVFISASRDWMESRFMFEWIRNLPSPGWEIASYNLGGHSAADRHNGAFGKLPELEKQWDRRFDRIFFMDSDQYYPPEYYPKMLAHTERVVASYSVSRYMPYEIGQYNNIGMKTVDGVEFPDYKPIEQDYSRDGCFECDAVGLGAAMFDRDLIDEIESPWFLDLIDSKGQRLLCDDFYFFSKLNQAGHRVMVDRDIMVGHYTPFLILPSNRHIMCDAHDEWVKYTGQG